MSLTPLRILGAAKDKVLAGPRSLYIDITTACNINCRYCWIHSSLLRTPPFRRHKHLEYPLVKKVVDTAMRWGTEEISLAGDGEPTIHPDIGRIITYIKARGFKLYLATNATFRDPLLPAVAHVDHVYVDLCCPDEDSYGRLQAPRNKGLFRQVDRNLQVLASLHRKHRRPYINIAFIITRENYPLIPGMLEYGRKVGIQEMTFRVVETGNGTERLNLGPREMQALKRTARECLRKSYPFNHNLGALLQGLEDYTGSPFGITRCYTGWFNLLVDVNKKVSICCHNENLVVGSLRTRSLRELWESRKAQELRLQCKYGFDLSKPPFRNECDWCHWSKENQKVHDALPKYSGSAE